MFHTNCISVTSIILQMKSISPPALPILITAGFPIWSINGVEHPEPDLKLENSGYNTTSNPTVITFMQTQGPSLTQYGVRMEICVHCCWGFFGYLFIWWWWWGGDAGIDLQDCFVQFSARQNWARGIQMPALDGPSTSLTAMSFRDKATAADHCVPSEFNWQTSCVVTAFTHRFIEGTLQIQGETNLPMQMARLN